MIVLAMVLAAGAVGAAATALVASRPHRDPAAPEVAPARVRWLVLRHRHLRAVARRDVAPGAATGLVLAAAATIAVATTVAVGVLLLLASSDPVTGRTDDPVAEWAAANTSPGATDVVRWITHLGDSWVVVVLAVVVAAVERRRVPARATVPFLALVVGGQLAVVNLVKVGIDRARPDLLQLTETATASFPSGHAAAAAACYAAFALVLGRDRSDRATTALAAAAGGITLAVAASRIALGVHWLTDVVAGVVVGWGWFALCSLAVGGRSLRFGRPVAAAQDAAG